MQFDPRKIERPDPLLLRYYMWISLLSGPLAPLVLLPLWFRYMTLRYKFDDAGVAMSWGILFRKEVYLTFRRLQDIHVNRNLLQRWMGLAKISLQTASGSSQAEMVIEGILEPELLRDYLYSQMRGAKNDWPGFSKLGIASEATVPSLGPSALDAGSMHNASHDDRALRALLDIKEAMQKLVDQKNGRPSDGHLTRATPITEVGTSIAPVAHKGEVS